MRILESIYEPQAIGTWANPVVTRLEMSVPRPDRWSTRQLAVTVMVVNMRWRETQARVEDGFVVGPHGGKVIKPLADPRLAYLAEDSGFGT